MSEQAALPGRLMIVRHGESEWNALGKWTGHTDVHLSEKGYKEAALMGDLLKDIQIDYAYMSQQQRTRETLEGILDASGQYDVPYEVAAAINERDYGLYTGKNKWEMRDGVGEEQFQRIRRSWDEPIPEGETLKMVYERAVPFYKDHAVPRLARGENVLLVAHGNSIRSLVKYIESVSDEAIGDIEMIFGSALLYHVDQAGRYIDKEVRHIDTTPPPA